MTTDPNAPYPPPGWPAYAPPPGPPPARRRRRGLARGGAAVAAVIAVKIGLAVAAGNAIDAVESHPVTPATVGSQPLMTSNSYAKDAAALKDDIADDQSWNHPQVAYYGKSRPVYYLIAGEGAEDSSNEVWRHFVDGLSTKTVVGIPHPMAGNLTCSTVTFSGVKSAMCTWSGGQSDGMLVRYRSTDLDALARTTAAARTAVNAD